MAVLFTYSAELGFVEIPGDPLSQMSDPIDGAGAVPSNYIKITFDEFDPGNFSKRFRGTFFRFETYRELSKLQGCSLHLDSDVICLKELHNKMNHKKEFIAYDVYNWTNNPSDIHHGINQEKFESFLNSFGSLNVSKPISSRISKGPF